ncbi:MAG: M15 family metallopeptidase [Treponema sp.]|nr:M15 family metallopeptidase [Treponema sp.]
MKSFLSFLLGRKEYLFFIIPCILAASAIWFINQTTRPVYAETPETQVLAVYAEEPPAPHPGERIMAVLAEAYPGIIGAPEFRDGDWAFQIRGRWIFYAEGRFLPEALRGRVAEYRALGFNSNYPLELPSWESGADQRAQRTRSYEESRNRPPQTQPQNQAPRVQVRRPNYFYEALWNASTREEASRQMSSFQFLGFSLTMHRDLAPVLRQVEAVILEAARTTPAVQQWINSLGTISGWNWRNVASSGNRSFHSYGIAVDILPRDLRGQATYWLWTSWHTPLWWNIPYTGRWHPPIEVIRAFESHGFTWGGKWTNFDTMHFEYRPEVFILSGHPLAGR